MGAGITAAVMMVIMREATATTIAISPELTKLQVFRFLREGSNILPLSFWIPKHVPY
jgi:hypothetical protein